MTDTVGQEKRTLTVREAQKVFKENGVTISERSVVRYCRKSADGTSLLDCIFDESERRHYITQESVENAVDEVMARKQKCLNNFSQLKTAVRHRPTLTAEHRQRTVEQSKSYKKMLTI